MMRANNRNTWVCTRARPHLPLAVAAMLVPTAAVVGPVQAACEYEVIQLFHVPDCGSVNIRGMANVAGHVTGEWTCGLGDERAFYCDMDDGLFHDLGIGSGSWALRVNDLAEVSGQTDAVPVVWFQGKPVTFEMSTPDDDGEVRARNNHGLMAGWFWTPDPPHGACMWTEDGTFVDLAPLMPLLHSGLKDCNDAGQLVGYSHGTDYPKDEIGILVEDGRVTVLEPIPGGYTSHAQHISESGAIAGIGLVEAPEYPGWYKRGFYRTPSGEMVNIGIDATHKRCLPSDVNSLGQAVGILTQGAPDKAFIWQDGVLTYLVPLLHVPEGVPEDFHFSDSYVGVNDRGWISCKCSAGSTGGRWVAVLAPIGSAPGDANKDCTVDVKDIQLLLDHRGEDGPVADCNGDGVVDGADLGLLLASWS